MKITSLSNGTLMTMGLCLFVTMLMVGHCSCYGHKFPFRSQDLFMEEQQQVAAVASPDKQTSPDISLDRYSEDEEDGQSAGALMGPEDANERASHPVKRANARRYCGNELKSILALLCQGKYCGPGGADGALLKKRSPKSSSSTSLTRSDQQFQRNVRGIVDE